MKKFILGLGLLTISSTTLGSWTVQERVDQFDNSVEYVALSDRSTPTPQIRHITSANMYFFCKKDTKQNYTIGITFNGSLILNKGVRQSDYKVFNFDVIVDGDKRLYQFSKAGDQNIIHPYGFQTNNQLKIDLFEAQSIKIQMDFYRDGKAFFEFDMTRASQSISEVMEKCGIYEL